MKNFVLVFGIILNLSAYGQTKKETIDWLNTKFENSPVAINKIDQFTRFLTIKPDGSYSIQSYSYFLNVVLPDMQNYARKTLFSGHFKNLDPNSVRTEKIGGNIYFYATCSSGKCITQQNQGPNSFDSYMHTEVLLSFTSDTNLEDRCKKAFTHLIKLCGGKKEAF